MAISRLKLAHGALLAAALLLVGCADDEGCEHGGKIYERGEEFAPDACNTCTCGDDGKSTCTAMACPCEYGGNTYEPGEDFPNADGCNTCTCFADGSVACTAIACASAP